MIYVYIFFIGLVGLGVVYQFLFAIFDKRRYPPLGESVDIGGRSLHVVRIEKFETGPTVILEAGNGLTSSSWMLVQPEIAKFANCMSYDRAGFGFSDGKSEKYTSLNDVKDLHRLMQKLNMPKPYILVGHSYGGMLNRLYANQYPDEIAGIVLVDAYHEDQMKLIPLPSRTVMLIFRAITYLGLFRLFVNSLFPLPKSLPDDMRKRIQKELTAYNWTRTTSEFFAQVKESARPFKNLPVLNKPVTVISAGLHTGPELKFEKEIVELQKDLVQKSTKGKQIIAEKSTHNIPFIQPEIIINSVREMISDVHRER